MLHAIETFEFNHNGQDFIAAVYPDDDQDAPWDREDGHGKIRIEHARYGLKHAGIKKPGEVCIHTDYPHVWLYDYQDAARQAREDGWDAVPIGAPDRINRAVRADMERMRDFLMGYWGYVGVSVRKAGTDEDYSNAIWGIESDCQDYLRIVARELAYEVPV